MGLFDDLLGAATAGGEGTVSRNTLASIVRVGLSEGLSGNAMQAALKGTGYGLRRGDFLNLVGQVRSSLGAGAWALGVDPNTIPGPDQIAPWSGGTPNRYLTRVNVYRRVSVGPGEYQVERRGLSFLSANPISPGQAAQQAIDLPVGDEGTDIGELLGVEYNGTYFQTGEE